MPVWLTKRNGTGVAHVPDTSVLGGTPLNGLKSTIFSKWPLIPYFSLFIQLSINVLRDNSLRTAMTLSLQVNSLPHEAVVYQSNTEPKCFVFISPMPYFSKFKETTEIIEKTAQQTQISPVYQCAHESTRALKILSCMWLCVHANVYTHVMAKYFIGTNKAHHNNRYENIYCSKMKWGLFWSDSSGRKAPFWTLFHSPTLLRWAIAPIQQMSRVIGTHCTQKWPKVEFYK